MTCTSHGLVTVVGHRRLKTIQFFKDIKFRKNGSAVFKVFFMEDSKYLCFNGAKNCHKVTSLGELNTTEIQQNIIEMFVVRVYFG